MENNYLHNDATRVVGWCIAREDGREYVYNFWNNGQISRYLTSPDDGMSLEEALAVVDAVRGRVSSSGGDVPDYVARRVVAE